MQDKGQIIKLQEVKKVMKILKNSNQSSRHKFHPTRDTAQTTYPHLVAQNKTSEAMVRIL